MRTCRNCRRSRPVTDCLGWWCCDCVRAFLKALIAVAAFLIVQWILEF